VLYSILGTTKLNGINPNDYLTAVLKRIGNHPINRIDELWLDKIVLKWTK
jgi:transposase